MAIVLFRGKQINLVNGQWVFEDGTPIDESNKEFKIDDEVYIKGDGEDAVRLKVETVFDSGSVEVTYNGFDYHLCHPVNLEILKPTERLVSELSQIAKVTGCYVAVEKGGWGVICAEEMELVENKEGDLTYWFHSDSNYIHATFSCPNCEDHTRQWSPNGEIL